MLSGSRIPDNEADLRRMRQDLPARRVLLGQATAYELQAGSNLYSNPIALVDLLAKVEGGRPCLASSSS